MVSLGVHHGGEMNANEFLATQVGFKKPENTVGWQWLYPGAHNDDHTQWCHLPNFKEDLNAQVKWLWKKNWTIDFNDDDYCTIIVPGTETPVELHHYDGHGSTRAEQSYQACLKVYGWEEQ